MNRQLTGKRSIFHKAKSQRGDTIVEVLICVLIVSMVLAGAYTTVHRSSKGIRNAQEHAEVLKLIQSQVEQMRTNASQPNPGIFSVAQPFCMIDGVPVSAANAADAPKCVQDMRGQPTTGQPSYKLAVNWTKKCAFSPPPPTLECYDFTVRADWAAVTGTSAQKTIYYRLHR